MDIGFAAHRRVRHSYCAFATSFAAFLFASDAAPAQDDLLPPADVMKLQILLDRQNFSCNCADGVWGERTEDALRAWQRRNSLPDTGRPDPATWSSLGPTNDLFTRVTVTTQLFASVTPVPTTWLGKSRAAVLAYGTVQEALAEQGHTSEAALAELNPGLQWPNPPPGTEVVLPAPRPRRRWLQASALRISLSRKWVEASDSNGLVIAHFPCSIAADKAKRPSGSLIVKNAAANPNYVFDPALFAEDPESRTINRKLLIQPGPNNPVGVAWIGLSLSGYGLHGTPWPEDIGRTASHGCFRLANWNAERLLRMARVGMPVTVEE